jgi:hypothetical protein
LIIKFFCADHAKQPVIPAKAGIPRSLLRSFGKQWIPAFAGITEEDKKRETLKTFPFLSKIYI